MHDAVSPDVDERTTTDERTSARADTPWVTVVWDDPVNLMSYVTYVFQRHFGFPRAQAERLMHQVDAEGRAIVATGPRESMEAHVAVHARLRPAGDRRQGPRSVIPFVRRADGVHLGLSSGERDAAHVA